MSHKVDPFIITIPEELKKSPELEYFFDYFTRWAHDMWVRSGGGESKLDWDFTDNQIIRANGTALLQRSTAEIDDNGDMTVNGNITNTEGITNAISTLSTTSLTLDDSYYAVMVDDDTAGGDVTITFPAAASNSGRKYGINKLGTTGNVSMFNLMGLVGW